MKNRALTMSAINQLPPQMLRDLQAQFVQSGFNYLSIELLREMLKDKEPGYINTLMDSWEQSMKNSIGPQLQAMLASIDDEELASDLQQLAISTTEQTKAMFLEELKED